MTSETFFAKFELLADAPNAVEKMRELVLYLAVRGKLVPQKPKDEPAEKLLARVATRLNGSNNRHRALQRQDTAEKHQKPFDVPHSWAWARFPELGEFGRGKSRHRPRNDPALYIGGKYRLVQTGDVARANGAITTHTGLYNEVGLAQSRLWPAGTLCITIAANIADSGVLSFEACIPDSVVGFIPAQGIPSVRYFEYFMRTAKGHLEEFAPSTAQKNINLGILEQLQIPIPPAEEQKRIVAKVDELMALCDKLAFQQAERETKHAALSKASLARFAEAPTPANLNLLFHKSYDIAPAELRKTILTLAVQGKLVPQEPNDEPAEDLLRELEGSLEIDAHGSVGGEARDFLFEIPSSWEPTRLSQLCEVLAGNAFQSTDFQTHAGTKVIKITNVGVREFIETDDYLPESFAQKFSKFSIKQGDILVALTRPYVLDGLKVARCPSSYDGALLNQRVGAVKVGKENDISEFLFIYLCSDFVLDYVVDKSKTLNQPNLNIPDLRRLPVPLPPLDEQRRIVKKVKQLMALVEALEQQLEMFQGKGSDLMNLIGQLCNSRA